MQECDLDEAFAIAGVVHPAYPEDRAVFAERLALYPAGCRVFDTGHGLAAYVLSHPWNHGRPITLNQLLGALPAHPDTYYVHDLALLHAARGTRAASAVVAALKAHAVARGFPSLSLVAVNDSMGFWTRHGFHPVADPAIDRELESYDPAARFMVRDIR